MEAQGKGRHDIMLGQFFREEKSVSQARQGRLSDGIWRSSKDSEAYDDRLVCYPAFRYRQALALAGVEGG
jgi:hypothetical protein